MYRHAMLILATAGSLVIFGCQDNSVGPTSITNALDVHLTLDRYPALNEEVTATCTFYVKHSAFPTQNIEARISPKEVETACPENAKMKYVRGDSLWIGQTKVGDSITFSATYQALKAGIWKICATASHMHEEEGVIMPIEGGGVEQWMEVREGWGGALSSGPYINDTPSCFTNALTIDVELQIDKYPALNETANLTCDFHIKKRKAVSFDSLDVTGEISFYYPNAFMFVSGDSSWHGTLAVGDSNSFSSTIKAVQKGRGRIEAAVRCRVWNEQAARFEIPGVGSDVIFPYIGEHEGYPYEPPSVDPVNP